MTKNYKWLTKNNTQVYIHKDKCDAYLKDGWIFGISKSYKNMFLNLHLLLPNNAYIPSDGISHIKGVILSDSLIYISNKL